MSKYKVIMMALFAVFAFSAVTAVSASAKPGLPEWLESGKEMKEAKPGLSDGIIFLENKKIQPLFGGGEIVVECDGQFHGTFGPFHKDLISSILDLKGKSGKIECTVSKTTNSICNKVGEILTVEADNLPWSTELLNTTPITDNIETEPTKGKLVGYSVTCKGVKNLCGNTLELSTFVKNEPTGAKFEFTAAKKAECTLGEGFVKGSGIALGFTVS